MQMDGDTRRMLEDADEARYEVEVEVDLDRLKAINAELVEALKLTLDTLDRYIPRRAGDGALMFVGHIDVVEYTAAHVVLHNASTVLAKAKEGLARAVDQ